MFNQEMPATYTPRKYMVRGVTNPEVGFTYYEIITPKCEHIIDCNVDYTSAVKACDILNEAEAAKILACASS